MGNREHEIYDVVGIGFGPSNLSLAIALEEHGAADPDNEISALFFERQPTFGWHRNMLLPTTTMQISFLKDLVTFRNPTSSFSFIAYLHASGRLPQFVNNQDFFPTRQEFHQYLEWAQARVADRIAYGSDVTSIRLPRGAVPELSDRLRLEVADANGRAGRVVEARNVVISTGLVPSMPEGTERDERVWHSSEFLEKYRRMDPGSCAGWRWPERDRAPPRSPGSCTTNSRTPRSGRSSRRTATPSRTTPPSPTRSSTLRPSTTTTSAPSRPATRSGGTTATPTTRSSTTT